MRELLRGAFVIARRDFAATVLSRTFLLFLLAPVFPVMVGAIFGGLAANVSNEIDRPAVAVVGGKMDYFLLDRARRRFESAFPQTPFIRLVPVDPEPDAEALRQRLLSRTDPPIVAVLEGGLENPRIAGAIQPEGPTAVQLRLLIDAARQMQARPAILDPPMRIAQVERSSGTLATARAISARIGQGVLFVLTMLLTTMMLSQLIEEKSNKIIEVLAAAVPVDSIFLGKLLAMLAASLLGIAVWAGAGVAALSVLVEGGLTELPAPAVGWPVFILLGVAYFATSYLLLGAVFLGIGAHASSAREVQTISMPVTMAQVVVFALSAIAVGNQGAPGALAVAVFPLSSPYVMIAWAAELPQLWPHAVAIFWQLLWVLALLRIASRLFRRAVLKSGPARPAKRAARA